MVTIILKKSMDSMAAPGVSLHHASTRQAPMAPRRGGVGGRANLTFATRLDKATLVQTRLAGRTAPALDVIYPGNIVLYGPENVTYTTTAGAFCQGTMCRRGVTTLAVGAAASEGE